MDLKKLCIDLAKSDSENEIIELLKKANYWDNPKVWSDYGSNENNFSTIGNQQSSPDAAIVEKLINSVDAVLMSECLKTKCNPESPQAPQNLETAMDRFFSIYQGKLSNLNKKERAKIADRISLIATGQKSKPCYTILDTGEGQTPEKMPETLLSLGKSNKLRIPFVQGKFNMGGTGVLQFCGEKNIQLIISRRNPEIVNLEAKDQTSENWGFTIVRREDPEHGRRSSSYRYLSPGGEILNFKSDSLPLLPGKYPTQIGENISHGTFIKLYEYEMTGLKSPIILDLYNRLSILMPYIALPIRLFERRNGYSANSYEAILSGLSVRLEEDRSNNLEEEFTPPPTSKISIMGQTMRLSFFVFKRDKSKNYRTNEGVIFNINGQTHGFLPKSFFCRQDVKMGYLTDSLLVVVDCSELSGRSREDLFMNSRDRLRSGTLRKKIEKELSDLIKNHPGLKALSEKRRREDIEGKLADSKPLEEVIKTIMKKSPTLSNLFLKGLRLPNPYKVTEGKASEVYSGEKFPTQFKLIKNYGVENPKICPINNRIRVQYKTDAANDYFERDHDKGSFQLTFNGEEYVDFSINLWNGTATLNIVLPKNAKPGEIVRIKSSVNDVNRVEPFYEEFYIRIDEEVNKTPSEPGKRKPPSNDKEGSDVEKSSSLDLPSIIEVDRNDWDHHSFNKYSALKVVDAGGEDSHYDFFINTDNIHLLTEKKAISRIDNNLLDARYKYGMVLLGLAMLNDHKASESSGDKYNGNTEAETIFEKISDYTKVVSPILLPMISGLGDIKEEGLTSSYDDE